MLLSFLTLFIPILGAWVSGAVIVLITLASVGTGAAVAMAAVILIAQQLDSMFVTPLVYQRTVSLHPIVTLTAVIVGCQLLGIVGAFLPSRWSPSAGPSTTRSSNQNPSPPNRPIRDSRPQAPKGLSLRRDRRRRRLARL